MAKHLGRSLLKEGDQIFSEEWIEYTLPRHRSSTPPPKAAEAPSKGESPDRESPPKGPAEAS